MSDHPSDNETVHSDATPRQSESPFTMRYLSPDKKSWILFYPRFWPSDPESRKLVSQDKPTVQHKIKMFGREVPIPRFQQSYGRDYNYSGSVAKSRPFTSKIEEIRTEIVKSLKEARTYFKELEEHVFGQLVREW